jgi:hypothetical protein
LGYTHYWNIANVSQHSTRWGHLFTDLGKIVKASPVPLGSWDGELPKPAVGDGKISFNGLGDDSHETFQISSSNLDTDRRWFCKTARKPYDIVVVACLATLKDIFGDECSVSSDGGRDEWADGVLFASGVLGRIIENPIED